MNYSQHLSQTSQRESLFGRNDQVQNNAGGFVFAVTDWVQLTRFLILGSEGGSYYASERAMTLDNAQVVLRCLALDSLQTVETIAQISEAGRAPKNDPAIFALAIAASKGTPVAKAAAFAAVNRVCRTATMFFQFFEQVKSMRGMGRGFRNAAAGWYTSKASDDLAYQMAKYRQRGGWSHRDVIRLAHPQAPTTAHNALFRWTLGKEADQLPKLIQDFETLQKAGSVAEVVRLLESNKALSWEMIPTQFLNDPKVWGALLPNMPATALLRNLARMTSNGLITTLSDAENLIAAKLESEEFVRKGKLHPFSVLAALMTYKSGRSQRGDSSWSPSRRIVDALDTAFYHGFKSVEPTGKRWLLGVDMSQSMTWNFIANNPQLSANMASAAMAMVIARTEKQSHIMGFNSQFTELPITPKMRMEEVCKVTQSRNFGDTDCAVPMIWALKHKVPVDVFVILTDNETHSGGVHPTDALKQYRQAMGINAKLIAVGMTATHYTVADPKDAGQMDFVGFDTNAPALMADFAVN